MTTSDYLLYTGLFAAILITQLGTRHPDAKRLLLPVAIVGGICAKYLKAMPAGTPPTCSSSPAWPPGCFSGSPPPP